MLCVDIRDVAEGCNVESTSEESEQVASDYISRIVDVLTNDHVLAFTDG